MRNILLFPWATQRDEWRLVTVPAPAEDASPTQMTAFGALVGLVSANNNEGPLYQKLTEAVKQAAGLYMVKYHEGPWQKVWERKAAVKKAIEAAGEMP